VTTLEETNWKLLHWCDTLTYREIRSLEAQSCFASNDNDSQTEQFQALNYANGAITKQSNANKHNGQPTSIKHELPNHSVIISIMYHV